MFQFQHASGTSFAGINAYNFTILADAFRKSNGIAAVSANILPKTGGFACCRRNRHQKIGRRIHWGEKEGAPMEEHLHTPEVYDFRKYDRLWQRVAPGLEPYPPREPQAVPAMAAVPPESQLPGAEQDPCCMGSAAAEMIEVLTGFIEDALGDQRQLTALSRQAPSWARQRLRELAAENGAHARELMAVHYLITGDCFRPSLSGGPVSVGRWCPALRERYHAAACSGFNYARAAEGTTDPCLVRLLNELSAAAYRQADVLLALLERSLRP